MKKRFLILLCICLALAPMNAMAVSAYPKALGFTERATGQTVNIINHGDESFHYMTDTNGYLLVEDNEGYLRYVVQSGAEYALGDYTTRQSRALNAGEKVLAADATSLQRQLQALTTRLATARPKSDTPSRRDIPQNYDFANDRAKGHATVCTEAMDIWLDDQSNYPPMQSTCPLLVLKVQFNDIKCLFSDAEWHKRIFDDGVSKYYTTVSNGSFTYVPVSENSNTVNDGVITVTLPIDCPRYALSDGTNQLIQDDPMAGLYTGTDGKDYAIYNMGSVYAYAMLAAEDLVDFDAYDRNNDGFLSPTELAVLVVYSGFEASFGGASAAAGQPAVWAHSWKYNNILYDGDENNFHYMTMRVDNKRVSKYTVIGELANRTTEYNYQTGEGKPRQAQYGTATHELGHDMGLADLYPTRGTQTSQLVYGLSLMASGSWGSYGEGEPGSSPTHLDPYSKIYLGFYQPTVVSSSGKYVLYASEPANQYSILRVNTDDPNVYYLLENREHVGYDRGLASLYTEKGGVVAWRIDEKVVQAEWFNNQVNNFEGRYGIMPIANANNSDYPFWYIGSNFDTLELQKAPQIVMSALSGFDAAMPIRLTFEAPAPTATPAPVPPRTGDVAQPILWAVLCFVGLMGMIALGLTIKKRSHSER